MKKSAKKLVLGVAFIMLMICMLCFSASAEVTSGECGDNLTWTLDSETGLLTISGEGEMWDYYLHTVSPFSNESIKTVIIGNGVTSLGNHAFGYCENLTSITIPDNVTSIGKYTFENCDKLSSVTLTDGLKSIGDEAFFLCESLTKIMIPCSVTSIGENVFRQCEGLDSIAVDENNKFYSSDENGVLFNKDKTVLIKYPIANSRKSYIIPSGVTSIELYAFSGCLNLSDVTIPNSVINIGDFAFYHCINLETIIPSGVEKIGDFAFSDCYRLTNITIPDSVTSIGDGAFNNSSLESITVDENNKHYLSDNGILFNKNKTELVKYPSQKSGSEYSIPDGVKTIRKYAFAYCELTSITIPDSVTSIGDEAFENCEILESVIIPDGVKSIGRGAFQSCDKLKSITIPSSLTSIEESTFSFCESLESVTLYDDLSFIGYWAFGCCTNLTSITIPDSVREIDVAAFEECTSLSDVYYLGSEEQWNEIAIGIENDCLLNANIHFHNHSDDNKDNFCDECGDKICEHEFSTITETATCTVNGYSMTVCGVCGWIEETEFFEATGHNITTYTAKAPTCTEIGWDTYEACKNCTLSTYVAIPALGHDFGEWVVTEESTYIKKGTETSACSRCDEKKERALPLKISDNTARNDNSGISVGYSDDAFADEVELIVEESFDGTEFITIPLNDFTRVSSWNIELQINGEKVQPEVPVLVSIPLPEGYNPDAILVFHINADTQEAELVTPVSVEDGYIRFMASSFSVYTVVDESSEDKGMFGFFDKLLDLIKHFFELLASAFKFDC